MAFNYAKRERNIYPSTVRSSVRIRRCSPRCALRGPGAPLSSSRPLHWAHWPGRVSAPGPCSAWPRCPGDLNAGIWILAPARARAPVSSALDPGAGTWSRFTWLGAGPAPRVCHLQPGRALPCPVLAGAHLGPQESNLQFISDHRQYRSHETLSSI